MGSIFKKQLRKKGIPFENIKAGRPKIRDVKKMQDAFKEVIS